MSDVIQLRFYSFVLVLILLIIGEFLYPYYKNQPKTLKRWVINTGPSLLFALFYKIFTPLSLSAFAYVCLQRNWGLFNMPYFDNYSNLTLFFYQLYIFDLSIYWQHRLFHKINFFWRFHKIHHLDKKMDLTTGLRFHPVELFFSLLLKFFLILTFGIDYVNIIVFESVLTLASLFEHANIKLPKIFEKVLRFFIVTPQMHYIHHSQEPSQMKSNYGFFLSIWDKLFGSYKNDLPENLKLGIKNKDDVKGLWALLVLPWEK